MDIARTIAKKVGHQMSQARGNGAGSTVFEVMMYRSPWMREDGACVVGAGKQCREHLWRGNGVWVTRCRRREEKGTPFSR